MAELPPLRSETILDEEGGPTVKFAAFLESLQQSIFESILENLGNLGGLGAQLDSVKKQLDALEKEPTIQLIAQLDGISKRIAALEETPTQQLLSVLNNISKRVDDLENEPDIGDQTKYERSGGFITGDTWWTGDGGLVMGNMYAPAEIVVPIADANPKEVEDAGEDGWAAGELNEVTFPTGGTEHYLTVPKAGRYFVSWTISAHTDAGGKTELHGGIMIDSTAQRDDGEVHRTVANTLDTGAFSSVSVVDCPNGTEEISLWVINDLSNDVHVVHANMFICLVAGTLS